MVVRRGAVGDIQLRKTTLLRPHERGSRQAHTGRHHADTVARYALVDLRADAAVLEDGTPRQNSVLRNPRQARKGLR